MNDFSLGDFVILPSAEDWGVGQVQSVIGSRVTVNFPHAGKQLINTDAVKLIYAENTTDDLTKFK
jgi:FKBP-type peptidyl-prolyl cis-trans isomerase 2